MKPQDPGQVTSLIQASQAGDKEARDQLLGCLYGDLRRIAGRLMQAERPGHTLQPTALVHELVMNLLGGNVLPAANREHFLCMAARAMRNLLVDHARGKRRGKRGGGVEDLALQPDLDGASLSDEKLLMVHEVLDQLQARSDRQGKVAELRIFGGLSVTEIAQALGVTTRTVDRDWQIAKAWLHTQLG